MPGGHQRSLHEPKISQVQPDKVGNSCPAALYKPLVFGKCSVECQESYADFIKQTNYGRSARQCRIKDGCVRDTLFPAGVESSNLISQAHHRSRAVGSDGRVLDGSLRDSSPHCGQARDKSVHRSSRWLTLADVGAFRQHGIPASCSSRESRCC